MTDQTINYTMNRKTKGSRTLFFATINGHRLGKTNWARKYDAVNEVKWALKNIGADELRKRAGL